MKNLVSFAVLGAAGLAASVALAAGAPPIAPVATNNPAAAEAGAYVLDDRHTSLIARTRHLGFGYTTIRFDDVKGTLDWDPADVTKSKVVININPKSINTPVSNAPGGGTFAQLLIGPAWLDAYTFNTAKFESTRIVRKDATHGTIEGNLTLKGVTKPVAVEAVFLAAGTDNQREPTVAFSGSAKINRRDFNIAAFPANFVGDEVELLIEVEFNKHGPNHRD